MAKKAGEVTEVESLPEVAPRVEDLAPQAQVETSAAYPQLAGVATLELVDTIKSDKSKFKASYINWARTAHMLHLFAPGWLPDMVPNVDGGVVHRAPIGGFLMLRFVHLDGRTTPAVPQAVMDQSNNSVPYEKISARDITDTQRRGLCLLAAQQFGLAYELWAKMPLESGYVENESDREVKPEAYVAPFSDYSTAITTAPDVATLQQAFAKGWHERTDANERADLKTLYDERKAELVKDGA